jgi:hypothetical protein
MRKTTRGGRVLAALALALGVFAVSASAATIEGDEGDNVLSGTPTHDKIKGLGGNDALAYVSPKSGRAVSASAGEPYRDRLLALPTFLHAGGSPGPDGVAQGFTLTGYFLDRHVWGPRGLAAPEERARFVALGREAE